MSLSFRYECNLIVKAAERTTGVHCLRPHMLPRWSYRHYARQSQGQENVTTPSLKEHTHSFRELMLNSFVKCKRSSEFSITLFEAVPQSISPKAQISRQLAYVPICKNPFPDHSLLVGDPLHFLTCW